MFVGKVYSSPQTYTSTIKNYKFYPMKDIINEKNQSLAVPTNMQNLHIKGGKLTTGLGTDYAKLYISPGGFYDIPVLPVECNQLFVYYKYNRQKKLNENMLIAKSTEGELYKCKISQPFTDWEKIADYKNPFPIDVINYRYNDKDVLLISQESFLAMYDGEKITYIDSAPLITSITEHYGRIFVSTYIDGDIWFSDDYNPENWNVSLQEGGYIRFSDSLGKTLKVTSFNDYVYIFREHGIYRLSAIGDQRNFQLEKVLESSSKIYGKSICLCGDEIVYLTNDGLFVFNGYESKNISTDMQLFYDMSENYMSCAYFNNKYVLAFKNNKNNKFSPKLQNDCLLTFDCKTGVVEQAFGNNISYLKSINVFDTSSCYALFNDADKTVVAMLDYNNKRLNKALTYKYESINCDFGYNGYKLIRSIKVLTKHSLTLKCVLDGVETIYNINPQITDLVLINKKAKSIKIILTGTGEADISGFEIKLARVKND